VQEKNQCPLLWCGDQIYARLADRLIDFACQGKSSLLSTGAKPGQAPCRSSDAAIKEDRIKPKSVELIERICNSEIERHQLALDFTRD
jgi:hypothetical protein